MRWQRAHRAALGTEAQPPGQVSSVSGGVASPCPRAELACSCPFWSLSRLIIWLTVLGQDPGTWTASYLQKGLGYLRTDYKGLASVPSQSGDGVAGRVGILPPEAMASSHLGLQGPPGLWAALTSGKPRGAVSLQS